MRNIIQKIKEQFPFDITEAELCAETCSFGCPRKLLDYTHMEITDWEERLENGDIPNFQDIKRLSKTSTKIYCVLEKNKLVGAEATTTLSKTIKIIPI